jgi:two-component system phosphate regulon sensor histidine kinase PhoR
MSERKSLDDVIVCDPQTANGAPRIRGTQVTVREILLGAAQGLTRDEIADQWATESEDVSAALRYAAELMAKTEVWDVGKTDTPDSMLNADDVEGMDMHKILVVDDLASNLKLAQLTFKGSEFTVSLAQGAEAALQVVEKEHPFLVLTDIQMPQINGLELCARLKANKKTENIAVIFITAHNLDPRQISEGLEMGADDYIARPFERLELLARVRAVARLKRAEIEARRQAKLAKSRNRELELLNELALAVSSSGTLQDILRASLQKLIHLLDVKTGALLLLDRIRPILQVNIAGQRGTFAAIPVDFVPEGENVLLTVQEQAPAIIGNLHQELYPDVDMSQHVVKVIPVATRQRVVGALAIIYDRQQTLKASDWMLLNSAIGLLTVALDNAYLLQSVRQQVADLRTLNEVGQALTSSLDQQQILGRTTQLVERSLRAEAAAVWLVEDQSMLRLVASSGICAQLEAGTCLSLGQGIAGKVVERGEPYFSLNTNEESAFFACADEVGDYVPGSILCVPLKLKDRTIGALQVWHRQAWWFDQRSVYLLESVANSVVIAVDNARLFAQVQAFNRELEQRVAERTRELVEEKEKTEAILASMADGLLVLDAEQCVLMANTVAEQMLGFNLNEMQGRSIEASRLKMPLWRYIDAMVTEEGAKVGDVVDISDPTRPGEVLSIQARSATILDDAQQVLGTVIVLRDITALKEVERMKARFMAGVTHELKTPLAVIQVNINNLMRYYGRLPRRKRKELLAVTERQVKILEQLVESILELSRMDSGLVQVERRSVNVGEVVAEVIADLRPLAASKPVALRWQEPTAAMFTVGDRARLERVVRNLVDNAIKYTPSGGAVEVALQFKEVDNRPSVVLDVTDTGVGIPPEHQTRIFERFYRVDPSHTVPGTGLGLSIVKEIVEAHKGEIQVHSVPEEGSVFTVTLPGVERSA